MHAIEARVHPNREQSFGMVPMPSKRRVFVLQRRRIQLIHDRPDLSRNMITGDLLLEATAQHIELRDDRFAKTRRRIDRYSTTRLPAFRALQPNFVHIFRSHSRSVLSTILNNPLNLAEGHGSRGGNKRLRYENAFGSLREVWASLETAEALEYIEQPNDVMNQLDRVAAGLWPLTRSSSLTT